MMPVAPAPVVFPGSSDLARLSRARDWAGTPLGPLEAWPSSLRTAAALVVSASFPTMLAWGPEWVQLYNDEFRAILDDKHPAGLGQGMAGCWPEVWDQIGPLVARVHAGETIQMDDVPFVLNRHAAPKEAVFTFSYSPVHDEAGAVGGVLVIAFETTLEVQRRQFAEERDRLHAELQVERSRLAFLFQRAPAFLAVLHGPEHVFGLVNDAYYQLVGHRQVIGLPVLDALPEIRDQGFRERLDRVLATGEPFTGREVPIHLARTRGAPAEERYLDLTYLPLVEADGTRAGVIAHGADVTEQVLARREVERLLTVSEQARAEAEAANRSKTDFLSAMSHELRTPLNAIGGYAELLALGIHGPVTPAQTAALDRITAGQRHLLVLINDILCHARLESGRLTFDLRTVAATPLLVSVEALLSVQAGAKGITLSVVPCDEEICVVADEERVRQILLNLVGNAIKFTDAGGRVDVSCDRCGEWVCVRVRDDGRGIAADQHVRIFDAFEQVGRQLHDPHQGVGLGLAISRDLAEGMGGDLGVESAPGQGSTFTLRLPRAAPAAA